MNKRHAQNAADVITKWLLKNNISLFLFIKIKIPNNTPVETIISGIAGPVNRNSGTDKNKNM